MPWRNGPQARPPGWQAAPERLPRSIAARLKSAGYLTGIAVTCDAPNAASDQGDDALPTERENQNHRDGSPEK